VWADDSRAFGSDGPKKHISVEDDRRSFAHQDVNEKTVASGRRRVDERDAPFLGRNARSPRHSMLQSAVSVRHDHSLREGFLGVRSGHISTEWFDRMTKFAIRPEESIEKTNEAKTKNRM